MPSSATSLFSTVDEIFRLVSHQSYIETLKIIKNEKNIKNEIYSPTVLETFNFNIKLTVQITYSVLLFILVYISLCV